MDDQGAMTVRGKRRLFLMVAIVLGIFLQMLLPSFSLCLETMENLKKSAELGDAVACFRIGLLYDTGSGVTKDRKKAEEWFKKGEATIDPLRVEIIKKAIGKTKKLPKGLSDKIKQYRQKADKDDTAVQLLLASLYNFPQNQEESIKWYRRAADGNCAYAQLTLAQLLGREDEKIIWFQRAGENGYPDAYAEIGDIHRSKKNYMEMLKWYRLAADAGDVRTQVKLGDLLREGKIVPKDITEAVKYYKMAADKRDISAMKSLATIYEKGEGVPKDLMVAIVWYKKIAEQDGEYGLKVAKIYHAGKVIPKDITEAVKWYRMAAEKGETVAIKQLISLYESGKDVPKDMNEAMKWHIKLAEIDSDHYIRIAAVYRFGEGVPRDLNKALAYYRMALKKNDGLEAMEALGDLYSGGQDIAKDIPQAADWYRKAAEKGNASAAYKLVGIYETEKPDKVEAVKWLLQAAELGNDKAQTRVGLNYLKGKDGPPDYQQARKWLRKAASVQNRTAMEKLAVLYRNGLGDPMSPKEAVRKWRQEKNIFLSLDAESALMRGSMIAEQYGYPVVKERKESLRKPQALRAAQVVAANDLLKIQKIPVISDEKKTVLLESGGCLARRNYSKPTVNRIRRPSLSCGSIYGVPKVYWQGIIHPFSRTKKS
ncbi:MAG: hypothetical protein CSYNP_04339 [Syntrophus sp. SKADARSKE-3]|nr:hypothetical protein [Syntrophus sp. SKADARSKE-3]